MVPRENKNNAQLMQKFGGQNNSIMAFLKVAYWRSASIIYNDDDDVYDDDDDDDDQPSSQGRYPGNEFG